jgi:tetratricopeptide (TPR) repeat protein
MKTVDKYVVQALDYYPYNLEEVIQALDYALSYDDKNCTALWLYGRVYSEQLTDYETAIQYYQQALSVDIYAIFVYPFYLDALLLNEDYDQAVKLIEFALTVKGIDKAAILFKKARLLERKADIAGALEAIKQVKIHQVDNELNTSIEELETRLKAKKKLLEPKAEKPEKKKKKKEKVEEKKKKFIFF